MTIERYFLSADNSGHQYAVPVSQHDSWYEWLDIPEDNEASWEMPAYAMRIDGTFTFTDPRMESQ